MNRKEHEILLQESQQRFDKAYRELVENHKRINQKLREILSAL